KRGATLPRMEIAHAANVTELREGDLSQFRTPPHNAEAEQALLGAMLVNNTAHARVAEFLLPEHFADAVHGRIYAAIGKLVERGRMEGGFEPFSTTLASAIIMAETAFKRSGRTTGVSTGFTDLDKLLGGLHPSDLVVIGARPSMGKTSLGTNIAFNAARTY